MYKRSSMFAFIVLFVLLSSLNCKKNPVDPPPALSPVWEKAVSCMVGARGAASFVIGSNAFIVSGLTNNLSNAVWQYDASVNTWMQKTNFGGAARLHAVGFSIGTKGYVGLGMDNTSNLADMWEYDSQTGTWTKKKDFPGGKRAMSTVLVIGQKAYLIGGYVSSTAPYYGKDVWEYDSTTDTWMKKSDFPGTVRAGAAGFVLGSKGYFGTGADSQDFWEYDPATDLWNQKADFSGTARGEAAGFSIGTKGYLGMGSIFQNGSMTLLKDFWEYDPQTNTWIRKSDFAGPERTMAIGCAIGSSGYFGLGATISAQNLSDWWKITP